MAVTSATIGSLGMLHAQMVDASLLVPSALRWLMGDLFGIIALTPAVLLLLLRRRASSVARCRSNTAARREGALVLALATAIGVVMWAGDSSNGYSSRWPACRAGADPERGSLRTQVHRHRQCADVDPVASAAGSACRLLATGERRRPALLTLFLCVIALIPQILSVTIFENRLVSARLIGAPPPTC